jgi:hypothetical protein
VQPEKAAQAKELFKRLTPTTPETAARTIVKGILRNSPRVLIGADARQIDIFQRLAPARASSRLAARFEKMADTNTAVKT